MMNYIWAGMIILSLVFSFFTGKIEEVSSAVTTGANSAIELILGILGVMCFWSGLMEVGNRSGITRFLSRIFRPLLRFLFPDVDSDSVAMRYISLNFSANLLGIGNAATPFGLAAMKELKAMSNEGDRASDSMLLLVVLNTASIQLLPTTVGAYRANFGSASPFDILPCVWVTSVLALCFGVIVAKLFSDKSKSDNRLRGERSWR